MLAEIKNTIKQSAIYGLSKIATKSASFILIPLYTSVYSSDVIANINLVESFWQYLLTICLFGFEIAIVAFIASEKDPIQKKKILFNFYFLLIINCIIFFLIGYFSSGVFSQLVLRSPGYERVIFYCFLIAISESLLSIPLVIAILKKEPKLYSTIAIASVSLNLFLQIYFIKFLNKDFEYIFISKFIPPLLLVLLFIPYVVKEVKVNFNFEKIKSILKFSSVWTLTVLLLLLLNSSDRFILAGFVSKELVAIYTIGYSIGSVTNYFILMPFNLAFMTRFFSKLEEPNAERYFTKTSTYLFFTMIISSLVLSFFIPSLIKIFVRNRELWAAAEIVKIILFANCISALINITNLSNLLKKNSYYFMMNAFISLMFNLILNFIFIKYFGIYAAAIITVISSIILLSLSYNFGKKIYRIKLEYKKLFLLSMLYILFVFTDSEITIEIKLLSFLLKFIYIILFFFILYLLKFFEPIEIERIKGFLDKYFIKIFFRKN